MQVIHFDLLQATSFTLLGLLLFEEMPWTLLGSCFASNIAYYVVLQTFPFIQLTSPAFIMSLGKFIPLNILLKFYWTKAKLSVMFTYMFLRIINDKQYEVIFASTLQLYSTK